MMRILRFYDFDAGALNTIQHNVSRIDNGGGRVQILVKLCVSAEGQQKCRDYQANYPQAFHRTSYVHISNQFYSFDSSNIVMSKLSK